MQIARRFRLVSLAATAGAFALGGAPVQAWTLKTLYEFKNGTCGDGPSGGLLRDPATGNLYGVTVYAGDCSCGNVFRLTPDGTETVLYTFTGGEDGGYPEAGLVSDDVGNLYGTTSLRGASGDGTVYRIAPDGSYTVLHAFVGGADGQQPYARLTWDASSGNLYGTTANYVAFKLTANGKYTVLNTDSDNALTRDRHGNFFGTLQFGGGAECSCGTIFTMTPRGDETLLYTFSQLKLGYPHGPVIVDKQGYLYGAGYGKSKGDHNFGSVFRLSPGGAFKVLHQFKGPDIANPAGDLVRDAAGNIYGVATTGGANGEGGIFEIAADGSEHTLYNFEAFTYPGIGGLIADESGNLYGVTANGGSGLGTVYELVK